MVGLSGLEPPTSCLSGMRSNHLSYNPSGAAPIPGFALMSHCRSFPPDNLIGKTFLWSHTIMCWWR